MAFQAIVVYPMNALANSQDEELRKFLCFGLPRWGWPGEFPPLHWAGKRMNERRSQATRPISCSPTT